MSESDADPFDEVRDYVIFSGSDTAELASKLVAAIKEGGLKSWNVQHGSTAEWLLAGNQASPAFIDSIRRGRIRVFLYSHAGAQSHRVLREEVWLRGTAYTCMATACDSGPTIVIATEGNWPAEIPVSCITVSGRDVSEIICDVVALTGPDLVRARTRETTFSRLGLIIKQSIASVGRHAEHVVMVFGPRMPRDFAEALRDINRTMLAQVREGIRQGIYASGWLGVFGEDLMDVGEGAEKRLNPSLKERVFGLGVVAIVVLVESPGAIAELSLISQYEELSRKTIVAVNVAHAEGFVSRGPVAEIVARDGVVVQYSNDDLQQQRVVEKIVGRVHARIERLLADRMRRGGNA